MIGPWTAHTLVVLDGRTAEDRTCYLCSDVPDFLERDHVVLKSVRSAFDEVLLEGMTYETFTRCPSESGAGVLATGEVLRKGREDFMVMSIMPPPLNAEDKRAVASWGLVNETIPEGRRWWDRYKGEEERGQEES